VKNLSYEMSLFHGILQMAVWALISVWGANHSISRHKGISIEIPTAWS